MTKKSINSNIEDCCFKLPDSCTFNDKSKAIRVKCESYVDATNSTISDSTVNDLVVENSFIRNSHVSGKIENSRISNSTIGHGCLIKNSEVSQIMQYKYITIEDSYVFNTGLGDVRFVRNCYLDHCQLQGYAGASIEDVNLRHVDDSNTKKITIQPLVLKTGKLDVVILDEVMIVNRQCRTYDRWLSEGMDIHSMRLELGIWDEYGVMLMDLFKRHQREVMLCANR